MATAALALSRAEQGSTISLSRLGVIIKPVTTNVAALKKEHDQATSAGVKFTAQLNQQYKAQLAQAKASDVQATRAEVLRVVQQRFGGTAATFAAQAAGSFARFQQVLHQFEVAIGSALLPGLAAAANGVSGFLRHLTASGEASRTAKQVVGQLAVVFHDLAAVVQFVAPPLEAVARALAGVAKFVGVGGILAFVGGFKALSVVVGAVKDVTSRYSGVLAAQTAAQAAEAKGLDGTTAARQAYAASLAKARAGQEANTVSVTRSTAALGLNTGASREDGTALDLSGAAAERAALGYDRLTGAVGRSSGALAANRGASRLNIGTGVTAGAGALGQAGASAETLTPAFRSATVASGQLETGLARVGATAGAETLAFRGFTLSAKAASLALEEEAAAAKQTSGAFATSIGSIVQGRGFETLAAAADAGGAAQDKYRQKLEETGAVETTQSRLEREHIAELKRLEAGLGGAAVAQGKVVQGTNASSVAMARNSKETNTLAAAQERAAVTTNTLSESLLTQDVALGANDVAKNANIASGALAGLKTELGGAATKLKAFGSGLFALAGGWITVAAVGIGGLAYGIYKLATAESDLQKQTNRVRGSLDALGSALRTGTNAAKAYGDAVSNIKTDKLSVAGAQLQFEQARQALATTKAAAGSLAYQQAVLDVRNASDQLRVAVRQLNEEERRAETARQTRDKGFATAAKERIKLAEQIIGLEKKAAVEGKSSFDVLGLKKLIVGDTGVPFATEVKRIDEALRDLAKTTKSPFLGRQLLDVGALIRVLHDLGKASRANVQQLLDDASKESARPITEKVIQGFEQGAKSTSAFIQEANKVADALHASDKPLSDRVRLLAIYAATIGRFPGKKITELDFRAGSATAAIKAIEKQLAGMGKFGGASGKEWASRFIAALAASGLISNVAGFLTKAVAAATGNVAFFKTALAAANNTVKGLAGTVSTAEQAVRDAGVRVADANQALADAISSGAKQIHDAVQGAEKNLFDIGSSLVDMVGQFLDAQKKTSAVGDISAKEYKRLHAQIIAGGGGPASAAAQQELASRVERAQGAASGQARTTRLDTAKRHISDLVFEFEHGQITIQTLVKKTSEILKGLGFNYKKAGNRMGLAYVEGFKEALAGLVQQAKLLGETPDKFKRGVGAFAPNIVNPLETIKQVAQTIDRARQQRDHELLAQAKDQTKLQRAEAQYHIATRERDHLRNQYLRAIRDNTAKKEAVKLFNERGPAGERALTAKGAPPIAPSRKTELDRLLLDLQKAGTATGAKAQNLAKDILRIARELGVHIPNGVARGVKDGAHSAIQQAFALGQNILDGLRRALRARSPSLAARDIGLDVGRGLALGILAEGALVVRAMRGLVERALAVARQTLGSTSQLFVLPGPNKGLLAPGNLDLLHRQVARIGKEIATVRSVSIGTDHGEVLIPTVIDGKIVSLQKAIAHFKRTGENLGTFASVAAANSYAERLHREQEKFYRDAGAALRPRLDVALRFHVEARTEAAAKQVDAFYRREQGRYVYTLVVARTTDAARELARFVSQPRAIRVVVHADTRPFERALAALHAEPVARSVRSAVTRIPLHTVPNARNVVQPLLTRDLMAAVERGTEEETLVGRQTVSELRANRVTNARGNERLLDESRRQTRILAEMLAVERRKPQKPKPSHAPGTASAAARKNAQHALVP